MKQRGRDRDKGATQIFYHHRKPPFTTRLLESELLLVQFCFKLKNLGFLVFIYDLDWYFGSDSVLIKKQAEFVGAKREEISMAGHCLFPRQIWATGTASTHEEKI